MVREISAILVSWRDGDEAREAIASLARARRRIPAGGPRVSLVVVDNGGALVRSDVLSLWPEASILVNGRNVGFGPAANQAAEVAAGDVLFFVNPDSRAEGEPFAEIARAFEIHPEAVALAPRLLDFDDPGISQVTNHNSQITKRRPLAPPDQEDQFTFQLRHLPGLASDARELLLIDHFSPDIRWRRRFRYADRDRNAFFEVEQAAAAALAVRQAAFRRAGGFDERFAPAWFEDVDLCARLLKQGKILYWPGASLRHRGGVSSQALGYGRFLPIYYRNALRYRRLRYSIGTRILYRLLLITGMVLRLIALPFRPTVPRPRRESARAYLGVLGLALGFSKSQFTIHNS